VGFVGHNEVSEFDTDRFIVFNGIEREVSEDPEIHIVEYPEIGFSFLAHPKRIDFENTKEIASGIVQNGNLDGVEKFSSGRKQYKGSINSLELANDDAHNILQVGTSHMEIEVNEITKGQVVQALSRRAAGLKNRRRRLVGSAIKNVNMLAGSVRTREREGISSLEGRQLIPEEFR